MLRDSSLAAALARLGGKEAVEQEVRAGSPLAASAAAAAFGPGIGTTGTASRTAATTARRVGKSGRFPVARSATEKPASSSATTRAPCAVRCARAARSAF